MKKILLGITLLALAIALPIQAQKVHRLSEAQKTLIERNVLANLEHSSIEVRATTIQLLIDMKKEYSQYDFSYALLPLMDMLKSDCRPECRILAALALYHLDSDLGKFAVSRSAQFDSSPRVAKHCAALIRNWDKNTISTDLIAEVNRY